MENNKLITIELSVNGEFATKEKETEAFDIARLAREVGWNVDIYIGEQEGEDVLLNEFEDE